MEAKVLDLNKVLHYREMDTEGKVRLAIMLFILAFIWLIALDTNSLQNFCLIFIPFTFLWFMIFKEMYKGGELWKNNQSQWK